MSRRKLGHALKSAGFSLSVELVETLRAYSLRRSAEEGKHVSMSRIVEEASREYLALPRFNEPESGQC